MEINKGSSPNWKVMFWGHNDKRTIKEVRAMLGNRPQLEAGSFAETYFASKKQAVAQRLWKIVQDHSVADITGVIPDDRFVEDLRMDDLDSMSLLEVTLDIEKDFQITIPDGEAAKVRTFSQLVDLVCRMSGLRESGPVK